MSNIANENRILATDPDRHIWVSASAGTGKTSLLLRRILRILLSGERPDKIVAITYTKAAAAEIKERVLRSLHSYTEMTDIDLQKELREVLSKDDISQEVLLRAREVYFLCQQEESQLEIQTIHSFCIKLLETFSLEAGLKVGFAIASKHQQEKLLKRAKEILLTKSEVQESLKHVAALLNVSHIGDLLEEIVSKRGKIVALLFNAGSAEALLEKIRQKSGVKITDQAQLKERLLAELDFALITEFFLAVQNHGSAAEQKKYAEYADDIKSNYLAVLQKMFLTEKGELRKKLISKNVVSNYLNYESIEEMADEVCRYVKDMEALSSYLDTEAVLVIALTFINIFDELKQQENLLDFDDIIFSVLRLLLSSFEKEWVFYKLRYKIRHILVDEAQDTSKEQWIIIKELLSNLLNENRDFLRSIFIVGDEKQSIYSFQGADFRRYKKHYQEIQELLSQYGQEFVNISLENSYRSQSIILDLVDQTFSTTSLAEQVVRDETWVRHIAKRPESEQAELLLMPIYELADEEVEIREAFDFPTEILPIRNKYNDLANKVALHVDEVMQSKNIPANEVMILVRSRNQLYRALKSSLAEQAIPFSVTETICLNEHVIFMDLLAIAKFYLEPQDDYNLASLLKSPFFSCDEEKIFALCYQRGDKSLYENIAELDQDLYLELNEIRQLFAIKSYVEGYLSLLSKEEVLSDYAAEFGFEESNIIISCFRKELFNASAEEVINLEEFKGYLEETQKRIDLNTKSEGKISLLTIHAAKGLEASLVILADVNFSAASAPRDNLLFADEIFLANLRSLKFPLRERIKQDLEDAEYSESCRLLYVALTRARDKLHMFASKNSRGFYEFLQQAVCQLAYDQQDDESYLKGQAASYAKQQAKENEKQQAKVLEEQEQEILIEGREESYETMLGSYMHKIWQSLISYNDKGQISALISKIESEIWLSEIDKQDFIAALRKFVVSSFWKNLQENYQLKSEVSIVFAGNLLRMDFLAEREEEIVILELKTDKDVNRFNAAYISKLELYSRAISAIYPYKKINSYLVFVRHNIYLNLSDLSIA